MTEEFDENGFQKENKRAVLPGTFQANGKTIPYLRTDILKAGNNDLSVSIPVILSMYHRPHPERILEYGNILHQFVKRDPPYPYELPHVVKSELTSNPKANIKSLGDFVEHNTKVFDLVISLDEVCLFNESPGTSEKQLESFFLGKISRLLGLTSKKGLTILAIPFGLRSLVWGDNFIDKYLMHLCGLDDKTMYMIPQPNFIMKFNRMGYGVAGNNWKQVDPLKSPNLTFDRNTPSARSTYLLFWGNFKMWW